MLKIKSGVMRQCSSSCNNPYIQEEFKVVILVEAILS
jgi:hypothetical protein